MQVGIRAEPPQNSDDRDLQGTLNNTTYPMKKLLTILALASVAVPSFAGTETYKNYEAPEPEPMAVQEINYNTFDARYLRTWFEDIPGVDDANGVGARFSISIIDCLYFAGSGSWQDVDTESGSTDLWTASAGLGAVLPISSNFHLVGEGGALFYGFDDGFEGADNNDVAPYAKPHVRARFGIFEVHAGAVWTDIDATNEWAGFVDTFIEVADGWDIAIGGSAGDKALTASAGFRMRF